MSGIGHEDQPVASGTGADNELDVAELKRRQARRRFLTGGSAVGAAILTLGQRPAGAYGLSTCLSLNGTYNEALANIGKSDVHCVPPA